MNKLSCERELYESAELGPALLTKGPVWLAVTREMEKAQCMASSYMKPNVLGAQLGTSLCLIKLSTQQHAKATHHQSKGQIIFEGTEGPLIQDFTFHGFSSTANQGLNILNVESRNKLFDKQFKRFKSCAVLSSVMKSCAIPPYPAQMCLIPLSGISMLDTPPAPQSLGSHPGYRIDCRDITMFIASHCILLDSSF